MKTIGKSLEKAAFLVSIPLVALVLGLSTLAARAESAQPRFCDARAAVLTTLDGKYAEKPVSMGLARNGTVVEVLNSPDSTWTIIMTAPNGVTCLLAAGDYWQEVPEKVPELPL